jgi:YVTN family beta-propeller protein
MRTLRRLSIVGLFTVGIALSADTALAKGDPAVGKSSSTVCQTCHGVAGKSPTDQWPNLAGQGQAYLVKQLKSFRDGTRKDPLMSPVAKGLSDDDLDNLTAYFSSITPAAAAEAAAAKPAAPIAAPHPPIVASPQLIEPRPHPTRQYWADQLPEGDAKSIITVKCQFCHDLQRAMAFARPREQWEQVVGSMKRRGSPLTPEETRAVINYLAKNFGPDSPAIIGPRGIAEVGMKPCARSEWPKGSSDFRSDWKGSYNVWVSNQQGGGINIVDPVTRHIVRTIKCLSAPDRIEFSRDGNTAYAPDRVEHNLTVIDTRTGAITAKVPVIDRPNTAVLSRDFKKLYMGIWPVRPDEHTHGYIQIVDTSTLKVVKTIETKGGIHDTWISPDGKLLLGMSPSAKFMNVYDASDDKLLYTCCTEAEIGTMLVEGAPDGSTSRFFISYSGFHGIVAIDARTGKEVQRVAYPSLKGTAGASEIYFNGITQPQVGGGSGFHGAEISPDGKSLWAISGSTVWHYSLPDLKYLGSAQLARVDQAGNLFAPAVEGTWLTVAPDGQKIYAVRPGRDLMSVIDAKTMKEEALIPTGEYPLHISIWPRGTP